MLTLERLYAAPEVTDINEIIHEVRHIETPEGTFKCLYWLVEGETPGDWRYVFRGDHAQALIIAGKHRGVLGIVRRYAARHFPSAGGAVEIGIPAGGD